MIFYVEKDNINIYLRSTSNLRKLDWNAKNWIRSTPWHVIVVGLTGIRVASWANLRIWRKWLLFLLNSAGLGQASFGFIMQMNNLFIDSNVTQNSEF